MVNSLAKSLLTSPLTKRAGANTSKSRKTYSSIEVGRLGDDQDQERRTAPRVHAPPWSVQHRVHLRAASSVPAPLARRHALLDRSLYG